MKKVIAIILSAVMILPILAGCKEEEKKPAVFIEEEVLFRAEQIVSSFLKEDFDNVFVNLNSSLSESLDSDKIQEAWFSVVTEPSENFKTLKTDYSFTATEATVVTSIKGTSSVVNISTTFDGDGLLSGLWLRPGTGEETAVNTIENDVLKEIAIKVGATDYKMDGILTLPKNTEKPPVVILIQGSGSSDMNEQIGENKPFMDIAHGLAALGVASVRYDKRYYSSLEMLQNDFTTLTIYDEVIDDANAAIELAAADERLDKNNIFIVGHSLGGMLAPKIAQDNTKVKGFVSIAGTLRKIQDLILDQNKAALDASEEYTDEEKANLLKQITDELDKTQNITEPISPDAVAMGYPLSYWHSMNEIDGAAIVKELTIPMLILQGSDDFQVYADVDFKLWQETLGERENVAYKEYEGLNHLMMTSNGRTDATEYDIAGNVSQEVIDDIGAFINDNK